MKSKIDINKNCDKGRNTSSRIRLKSKVIVYKSSKEAKAVNQISGNLKMYSRSLIRSLDTLEAMLKGKMKGTINTTKKKMIAEIMARDNFNPEIYYETKANKTGKFISNSNVAIILSICNQLNIRGRATLSKITDAYNLMFPNSPKSNTYIRMALIKGEYSYKKCGIKNPKLLSEGYKSKAIYILDILSKRYLDDYVIISVDESPINCFNKSGYFWGSKHQRQIHKEQPELSNYSLMMAITHNEVINFEFTQGNNNAKTFWTFMRDTLDSQMMRSKYSKQLNDGKVLFLIDNASIHMKWRMMKKIITEKVEILYNLEYQSDFNAIEKTFRLIKTRVKNYPLSSDNEVLESFKKVINELNSDDLLSCFIYSLKHMITCIRNIYNTVCDVN